MYSVGTKEEVSSDRFSHNSGCHISPATDLPDGFYKKHHEAKKKRNRVCEGVYALDGYYSASQDVENIEQFAKFKLRKNKNKKKQRTPNVINMYLLQKPLLVISYDMV